MQRWIPSWQYVPINYNTEAGVFEDVTQKAVFTNNLNGGRVRVRLCNLYNSDPMRTPGMTVAVRNRRTGRTSPGVPVALNGKRGLVIPPTPLSYQMSSVFL